MLAGILAALEGNMCRFQAELSKTIAKVSLCKMYLNLMTFKVKYDHDIAISHASSFQAQSLNFRLNRFFVADKFNNPTISPC